MTATTWRWAAAAFLLLAVVDLTAIATGHDAWRAFTKPPLMLLLALAFTQFDRALAPPFAPLVVMLTYLVAQTMIAAGMTAVLSGARPAPGIPVDGLR
jgi:hypothetical protein